MPNESDYDKTQDLKDYVEEFNPLNDTPASMFHDLLNGALSEVDWKEVLEHFQHDWTLQQSALFPGQGAWKDK